MSHEMFLAEDFIGKTKNIYEAVMIIAARARQISEEQRREMDAYLSQVEMLEKFEVGDDEGMIEDTPIPHEPMLQFEKPSVLALREMIADKLEVVSTEEAAELVEEPPKKEPERREVPVPPMSFPGKISLIDLVEEERSDEEEEE